MNILTSTLLAWLVVVVLTVGIDVGSSYLKDKTPKKYVGTHRRV